VLKGAKLRKGRFVDVTQDLEKKNRDFRNTLDVQRAEAERQMR